MVRARTCGAGQLSAPNLAEATTAIKANHRTAGGAGKQATIYSRGYNRVRLENSNYFGENSGKDSARGRRARQRRRSRRAESVGGATACMKCRCITGLQAEKARGEQAGSGDDSLKRTLLVGGVYTWNCAIK